MRQFSCGEPDRHLVNIFKCDRSCLHVASCLAANAPSVDAGEKQRRGPIGADQNLSVSAKHNGWASIASIRRLGQVDLLP
jgi:hypothetical protein